MKKVLLLVSMVVTLGSAAAVAAPPVIFYSDLTSGPKTDGQNDKGVFVTVAGKNFGSSRGTSAVAVGGGAADNYPVWTDKKITFQLGSAAATGNIVVTTPQGASNGIHFTVRSGRIFFVNAGSPNNPGSGTYSDPWRSPRSYFTAQQPGDTCYFRAGLYSGQYGNSSRPYNVSFYNSGIPSGSADNEIAWAGYPGETALFKADDSTVYNGAFEFNSNNQYFVLAGLSIYGRGDGREQVRLYSDNDKLVNCSIEGIKTLSYGMIGVTASNLKIWGNECFGAKSANKLDHIIYFQSGGQSNNVDIGWNYIHDNDIAVGPVFSWNLGSGTVQNINIHDNKIDCRNSSDIVRLAGIWSGADGTINFINNLIIGAGGSLNNDSSYNAIYIGFGKVFIYHNTFYLSRGAGSCYVINAFGSGSADVRNNVFYNQNNISYVNGSITTLGGNCYFGGAGGVPSGDAHAVSADPAFVNGSALDLHLAAASPCVGKGLDLTAAVPRDYDGIFRLAGAVDIGAFQYDTNVMPPSVPPAATASISGSVRDAAGNGIGGVAVTLTGVADVTTAADGAYRFADIPSNQNYTITASRDHWRFSPITLTLGAADATDQIITGTPLFTVSGVIRNKNGQGVSGVSLALTGGAVATTTSVGSYQFVDLAGNGGYTVTPALANWMFVPSSFVIDKLVADVTAANFTGQRTYHIRGYVKDIRGTPLKNVDVSLTGGGLDISRMSDDIGYYEFLNLPESNDYRIKSAKSGYYFSPATRSTSTLSGYIDGWNFEGAYINTTLGQGEIKVVGSAPGRGTINPDRGETPKVYYKGTARGRFECRIFTLTGELVWENAQDNVQEGTFDWPATGVASGIYTAHVRGPGIDTYKKIAIVR